MIEVRKTGSSRPLMRTNEPNLSYGMRFGINGNQPGVILSGELIDCRNDRKHKTISVHISDELLDRLFAYHQFAREIEINEPIEDFATSPEHNRIRKQNKVAA